MKTRGFALLATVCLSYTVAVAADPQLQTDDDKVSYSVGYQVGGDFQKQGVDLNAEAMVRGAQDAITGTNPLLTAEEMSGVLIQLKQKIMFQQQEARERRGRDASQAGTRYLAENAKKTGVTTTASGLQYEVLQAGTGAKPKPTDKVTVHYRGTLIDGTEFDSSYSRGQPASFTLDRVIKGWTEGLQLMSPGGKYHFVIPADLAYGPRATGSIPPNSTLIFEVELLSVGE